MLIDRTNFGATNFVEYINVLGSWKHMKKGVLPMLLYCIHIIDLPLVISPFVLLHLVPSIAVLKEIVHLQQNVSKIA